MRFRWKIDPPVELDADDLIVVSDMFVRHSGFNPGLIRIPTEAYEFRNIHCLRKEYSYTHTIL